VKDTLESPADKKLKTKTAWEEGHDPILLSMIASALDIPTSSIADFELSLYDTQPASLGGANDEFLYSARLDNQGTCFTSITSLAEYADSDLVAKDTDISMVCLFDHEEVGSASQCGAGSPILGEAVRRVSAALNNGGGNEDFFQTTLRKVRGRRGGQKGFCRHD
jgi:aspartyl aminopeptidase